MLFTLACFFSATTDASAKTFTNINYDRINAHVENTPDAATRSAKGLSEYLAGKDSPARNDFEKAWAIFKWITYNISYDTKNILLKKDVASKKVLKRRVTICEGYSNLFADLADLAGLRSVVIPGHSKGYGFVPGQPIKVLLNHAWNAVKIEGSWYLLDATWGAGHLNDNKRFAKSFTPHYFLTPPEEFIYDHYPEEKRQQLLARPLTMDEYLSRVKLWPRFFESDIGLISHNLASFQSGSRLKMTFSTPPGLMLVANLTSKNRTISISPGTTFSQKSLPPPVKGSNYTLPFLKKAVMSLTYSLPTHGRL